MLKGFTSLTTFVKPLYLRHPHAACPKHIKFWWATPCDSGKSPVPNAVLPALLIGLSLCTHANLWMDSLFTVRVQPCCVLIMRQLSDNGHRERVPQKWNRKVGWDAKLAHFLPVFQSESGHSVLWIISGEATALAFSCHALVASDRRDSASGVLSGASLAFGLAFDVISTLRVIPLAARVQTPAIVHWNDSHWHAHGWIFKCAFSLAWSPASISYSALYPETLNLI